MTEEPRVLPGRPSPLGASVETDGVNFAVFSEHATSVELCLFDSDGGHETERIPLTEKTAHVWHGLVRDVKPGQLYGYRVDGPYEPQAGMRFNPAKLLIDPYAHALTGNVDWQAPVFGYRLGDEAADLSRDDTDDAAGVPKGIVLQSDFDWQDDAPPATAWSRSVIYEVHVKGFTQRHPGVPESLRGTYAGFASEAALAHLTKLGITAVELMPVHAQLDAGHLVEKGLKNYWGYDTINFFAPDARYASAGDRGAQVDEFKTMVKALHRHGIEVILDVVYNHSVEGNELGPTLSFKGLDNASYYRLVEGDARYYMDYTGTGNTLNLRHPQVLQLVMDSLRYWVQEMHVDGFRFDLASALARELYDVDRLSSFLDAIHQDPVISQVKLIAEPWDVGEGGYQVGNFPVLWAEWNGRYRDTVRRFWKGDDGLAPELASRLTGSSDLYEAGGRRPDASINFITAHDGFSLNDLVSYNEKHNEANGEDNRDGNNDNASWNCGAEGETDDAGIIGLREQQKRNFLATLLFSQGVPMICGGDEIGRTQQGNNNAYCQDNELSWLDWELDERRQQLLDYTARLISLRREHPALHRRNFFVGEAADGETAKDIVWLKPDGQEIGDEEWSTGWVKCLGVQLSGELGEVDEQGAPVQDDTLLLLLNAAADDQTFALPPASTGGWQRLIDSSGVPADADIDASYALRGRSLALLHLVGDG